MFQHSKTTELKWVISARQGLANFLLLILRYLIMLITVEFAITCSGLHVCLLNTDLLVQINILKIELFDRYKGTVMQTEKPLINYGLCVSSILKM